MSDELMFVKKSSLQSVADKIKAKAGTEAKLSFPNGFNDAIDAIESGGDTSVEDALLTKTLSGDYVNDRITTLGQAAFAYNTELTSVSLGNISTINKSSIFTRCTKLTEARFDALTSIVADTLFNDCLALEKISAPIIESISGTSVFYQCKKLTTLDMPLLKTLNPNYGFRTCTSLTKVTTEHTPLLSVVGQNCFNETTNLKTVKLPLKSIGSMAFYKSALDTLILEDNGTDKLCTLSNVNAFTNTPIAEGKGYFYITSEDVEELKAMTNWVTYADQIRAKEDWNERIDINTQPTDISAVAGTSITFSVVADGMGLEYQWQTSKDNGITWSNNSNVTADYNVNTKSEYNGYQVRCIITNINGVEIISNSATLTVTTT